MELALRSVWVDDSLRADAIARRRADSLFSGSLDHFFHYQSMRQAQLWLDVHRAHAPLFSDAAFTGIFQSLYRELVSSIARRPVHVVALGPGAGSKESLLLQALVEEGIEVRYTPIDASLELACRSASSVPAAVTDVSPVAGDLSMLSTAGGWLEEQSAGRERIVTAFGIAPNFAPSELFARCASIVRAGDRLLLSANLAGDGEADAEYRNACEAILPQYDNIETKRWIGQVLRDWDLDGYLSEPSFRIGAIENVAGFIASARWLDDVAFEWEGRPFSAARGSELRLFYSLRYTSGRLKRALAPFGFALGSGRLTPNGQEGVWIVSPAGAG